MSSPPRTDVELGAATAECLARSFELINKLEESEERTARCLSNARELLAQSEAALRRAEVNQPSR